MRCSGRCWTVWRSCTRKRSSPKSTWSRTTTAFTRPRQSSAGWQRIPASRCCSCRPTARRPIRLSAPLVMSMTSARAITSANESRIWSGTLSNIYRPMDRGNTNSRSCTTHRKWPQQWSASQNNSNYSKRHECPILTPPGLVPTTTVTTSWCRQPLGRSVAFRGGLTDTGADPYRLRPFFFHRPQHLRGLLHLLRLHPEQRPIPPLPCCYRIAGRHIDLGRGQLGDELGHRTQAILALDQEPGLGAYQRELRLAGRRPKGRHIGRNEIELGPPSFRKARICQ